ncbi:TnsD family Tn7-like transposition protein [Shewanella sairae]|uniref:TnsD family Tn7-like transposition protein n=1 Tax=Shewanella sairae TaxID=190310 RepID=UPI001C813A3A|nr:TnsD family Tn7-like transposition protein [Shewanella sairae]MCL1131616.1 TnsD family transposase [Shewanella sairae]
MLIPPTFPDEILFSRIIRHFTLSGMTTADYLLTAQNSHKVSIHPYLTAGLDKFSQLTQESATELLNEQTLAPLFIHFLPSHASTISLGLISTNATDAIRACQLVCVREKESLSIKYCPACAKADAENFGVPYWHRSHQIPGIESCSSHQVKLVHFPLKGRSRLSLSLLPPLGGKPIRSSVFSRDFALYSYDLLQKVSQTNKPFELSDIKNQLYKLGYVTRKGYYRRKLILSELYQFTQKLGYDSQDWLPESDTDYRYISYLLSEKVAQQPLKYLVLGFWLSLQTESTEQVVSVSKNEDLKHLLENKCIELLHQGESMASVSRLAGKSRCFIKALALRFDIPVNLKPKQITQSMKAKIMFLGKKGFHRKVIAARVCLSVGSVEQQISTSPVLVQWRKQCRHESKRRKYKLQIIRFIQKKPSAIRQQIKSSCNAAFFWLYTYEKQWLEANLPKAKRPVIKPRVDWHQRDLLLVTEVSSLMRKHHNRLSRTQLDLLLGGHGWFTKNKHKLPKSLMKYQSLYEGK